MVSDEMRKRQDRMVETRPNRLVTLLTGRRDEPPRRKESASHKRNRKAARRRQEEAAVREIQARTGSHDRPSRRAIKREVAQRNGGRHR